MPIPAGRGPLLLAGLVAALSGCAPTPVQTSTPRSGSPAPVITAIPASGEPVATQGTGAPSATPAVTADLAHLSVSVEPFTHVDGSPLAVVAPNDGSGRLFIVAQDGRIWVSDREGKVLPDPMVDLRDELVSGGEQGLLGLALHAGFPNDPRVYVNYTNKQGDTVIASLQRAGDPGQSDRLDPASEQRILFVDQPYANHNGGDLLFGPDGYLYAFFGDGGSGGDPHDNGQNRDTLLGKILRIDVDHPNGKAAYSSPEDNPFAAGGGRPEIWAMGVRNPWRNSFDRATGDLWIGDVGQSAWEEIDVVRAGDDGGNLGWNRMEGNHCYPPGSACSSTGLRLPVTEYGHDLGCTVVGGYVYRGSRYPSLTGVYLFADYCSGRIWALDPATDGFRAPVEVGNAGGQTSSFGEDAAGELYVTNLDGTVSRVVAGSR